MERLQRLGPRPQGPLTPHPAVGPGTPRSATPPGKAEKHVDATTKGTLDLGPRGVKGGVLVGLGWIFFLGRSYIDSSREIWQNGHTWKNWHGNGKSQFFNRKYIFKWLFFPLYAVFLIFTDNTKGIHHHRVPPFGENIFGSLLPSIWSKSKYRFKHGTSDALFCCYQQCPDGGRSFRGKRTCKQRLCL